MHLAHPSLTMGGKRKGKQKFRNADEARKARELAAEWEQKQKEWAKLSPTVKVPKSQSWTYSLSTPHPRSTKHIPSLPDTHVGPVSSKATPKYTGTKMLGIGTLHKSNAVPIFTDQEAQDISRMRRG